tara:strand:- start:174 stop:485 length:312 start_codon:yes stop_codon:yes gene_type:complete
MEKKVWAPILTRNCAIRVQKVPCIRIDDDGNYQVRDNKKVTFTIPKEYVWDPDLKDGKEPTKEERVSLALRYKQHLNDIKYDVDKKSKSDKRCLDRPTKSLKL